MSGVLHGVTWAGSYTDGHLVIVDQTRLPGTIIHRELSDLEAVREAIVSLAVRGAPAIGIAAAYGVVVHVRQAGHNDPSEACSHAIDRLGSSRPTAVNLAWALARMRRRCDLLAGGPDETVGRALLDEAQRIHDEDATLCNRIARHGAALLPAGGTVYTHCNTGALATGGVGTALGCIVAAHAAGAGIHVIAGETRPLLQGARLTVPELIHAGVPVALACDSAAGALMSQGRIQAVIVGADRIAANGDTANKIGTYGLAVLARHHRIPFIVAAPSSTFDLSMPDEGTMVIEDRASAEVSAPFGARFAPAEAVVLNPAFDVTPAGLITALVTEHGVLAPPDAAGIARLTLAN